MRSSITRRRAFVTFAGALAVTACGHAAATSTRQPIPLPGDAIDQVLAPQTKAAFQSEVLVLATVHLSGFQERLRPGHLEHLLSRLEAYAPTRIAIEALTADELALLAERETHDSAAAEVLDMFGRAAVTAGKAMQQALRTDRVAAEARSREWLARGTTSLTTEERLDLVGHLLAAYEYNSAMLQWSYLPAEARERTDLLPASVKALLNRRLQSANEVVTLALPLARRLGLQRIHPIDSQYEGVRTLSAPKDALARLFEDPAQGQLQDQEKKGDSKRRTEEAFASGDLLPLYLHINSEAYQAGDVTQWNWLFQGRHASGLDRFRYAMWELRNLRQATNIIDAAASTRPERLLVIVGASHKAYLDRLLGTQLGVRLAQLRDLERAPGATR